MKLLEPTRIGTMALKNRMVMAPMTTNYGNEDQTPSERLIAFLLERAKGGVGLITVEVCTVDVKQKYQPQSLTLGDDTFIESHRRLTEALHQYDVKVQPQITHPGPESLSAMYSGEMPIAPSASTGACTGLPAREVTVDELDGIVESYAQAARRAREAGYDGIELHAAHCYMLLGTFLSPLKNKRQDEYGADTTENRTRLLVRVLKRIKAVAGADFPITLRISGFERIPGGRDSYDTAAIAPTLVEAGVDAFHVSGGVSDPMVSQMICGPEFPDGYNLPAAEAIKRVVDVPVMVVGRFLDPEFAEQALQDGRADMIVMGRPLLADPHLPDKLAAGKLDQIRRCISCQNCIDSMFLWPMDARMNCAVNPAAGRELQLNYAPAEQPKHVVVVGAGPAGMEAARVAAERGHQVTLLERQQRLGGSLVLASAVHSDNGRFLKYLCNEIQRLPITVRLGFEASVESVLTLAPDAVIVATGAKLDYHRLPGMQGSNVLTGGLLRALVNGELPPAAQSVPAPVRWAAKVFAPLISRYLTPERIRLLADRWLPVGRRVAILGADLAAIEVAEFLALRGREVMIFERGELIAPEIGPKRRLEHEKRLESLRVSINTRATVTEITRSGIKLELQSGFRKIQADTVIVPGEPVADTRLHDALCAAGIDSHLVGDASGLGLIVKAAFEGHKAATHLV
ncbi:2,4-dienoyl-CoA reductase (NADPH2) [Litorivivens lipolytica]|uniref:2,4-dienoyl-CoA reductase (NADPH2) n=1 Tax=Litorivivens lipolytica TaxID=1524264 RepID=A0A7W4W5N3_9GAMM|nr:FAD-dependent oxidoreductase [Litorivivens lipolytica]MBB3047936.1 2,4-dienoyl-CoA reductase (NADPH2) [Litorivivens lipolytica]